MRQRGPAHPDGPEPKNENRDAGRQSGEFMKKRNDDDFPFNDLAGGRGNHFPGPAVPPDAGSSGSPRLVRSQGGDFRVPASSARPPHPAPGAPARKDGYYTVPQDAQRQNRYAADTIPGRGAPSGSSAAPARPRTMNRQIRILSVIAVIMLIILAVLSYFVFFTGRNPAAGTASSASTSPASSTAVPSDGTSAVTVSDTSASTAPEDPNSLANLPPSAEHPVIALTFDDGPAGDQTSKLLDILKEKGVHVTFFLLGNRTLDTDPALLQRMLAEGHEIGNHSYDHAIYTGLTADQIREELKKTNDAIFAATGQNPTVMRPPTGGSNDTVLALSKEMNLPVVNWSWQSCPEDWLADHKDPAFISQYVIDNAANGHIVLLHDIHATTVDSISAMIDGLAAKGYRFATVSELLSAQPAGMQTGVVYYNASFT